jgi:hypothetical protein
MVNSPNILEAFKKVFEELSALSQEEFEALLDENELGDVGQFMLSSGAANLIFHHINHKYDEEAEECSCGCSPHDPCFYFDCPHCDLPENHAFLREREEV